MNEEQLHKWLENYEAGLEISSASRLSKRRKEAMEYADGEYPEAPTLRKAVGLFLKNGKSPDNLDQLMGLRMVQGTSVAVRRFLDKNPELRKTKRVQFTPSPEVVVKAPERNSQHPTVVETYMQWIETSSEVPNDKVLAHFIGCTHAAIGSARREAINRGYTFDHQHGGSWKVVNRPSSNLAKASKRGNVPTPEEVNRVIKFLLKEKQNG